MNKKKTFEFLYARNRFEADGENLRVRTYRAVTLAQAAIKMAKYLRAIEERTDIAPWCDEEVVHVKGRTRTMLDASDLDTLVEFY